MAETYSKPAYDLAVEHAYACGWNAAVRAAATICENKAERLAGMPGRHTATTLGGSIRNLDRSMQVIDD